MNYRLLLFPLINLLISSPAPSASDAICYFSLNQAALSGQNDSITTVENVKHYGDFGIGTETKLAAELVLLDGKAYGIASDGKVRELSNETPVAYTVAKKFLPDTTFQTGQTFSLFHLKNYLRKVMHKNSFSAIRIRGKFSSIECRSFFPQDKPYPLLNSAKAAFFDRKDLNGTIVGFFTPASAAAINSPVYHFHFISDDKSMGGHIKKLELQAGAIIEIDYAAELQVTLPSAESTTHIDLNQQATAQK